MVELTRADMLTFNSLRFSWRAGSIRLWASSITCKAQRKKEGGSRDDEGRDGLAGAPPTLPDPRTHLPSHQHATPANQTHLIRKLNVCVALGCTTLIGH